MSNNTGNTLLALLAGAAIGAIAGILMAPDKGSKTREKIKTRMVYSLVFLYFRSSR